tara:strand:- start:878 stop:1075 length:198 start_codon:yes stop_codon:yes gene_type:complete
MFDLAQQALVFPCTIRQLVKTPRIVATGVHSHHLAQTALGWKPIILLPLLRGLGVALDPLIKVVA